MAIRSKKVGILAIVAAALAVLAAIASFSALAKTDKLETTKELGASAFSIGMLDDTTGKLPDEDVDKGGLYTAKYYTFEGMDFEFVKNATVELQVNYFNADKEFLGVQTWTTDYDSTKGISAASTAKYVKFEIIPTEDDDDTVGALEKYGYVDQVEITVKK